MTTRGTLNLKGLNEYLEALARAGVDIDAAAQRAEMKGAVILHEEMDIRVPKDTGNLQEHIVIVGPFQEGNFSYVEVGVINADANTATYGNVQEYGSPSKNIKAQPYIRPSIDGKKSVVLRTMRQSLKDEGYVD